MHTEILDNNQIALFSSLNVFKKKFYLAGGTAIALHIGHRKSIDFDLFSESNFNSNQILGKLKGSLGDDHFHLLYKEEGQLHLMVKNVKLTFYHYPYKIPVHKEFLKEVMIPDLKTLAAMKALALGGRNKWKDYVDMYFLLRYHFSFDEIAKSAEDLFHQGFFSKKLFRGQLSYFEDIDYSEVVEFLPGFEVSDKEIKEFLVEISTRIL